MTLVRWNPLGDWMQASRQVGTDPFRQSDSYGAWAPNVDVFEMGEDLVLRAEVPGIDRKDIDIHVENHQLILSGERKWDSEITEENAHRVERNYGKFVRSFQLPKTVDAANISASYKDGILEVRLPKMEAAKPRKISIKVA